MSSVVPHARVLFVFIRRCTSVCNESQFNHICSNGHHNSIASKASCAYYLIPNLDVHEVADVKEGTSVRRRGRPRKKQDLQGKRLFDEHSSSEEEDSISGSDQDAAGVQEKQDEDDEDEPLIHSLRASSKLRSLRVSKEDKMEQTEKSDARRATEELSTPKTSGNV